jgi:cysteinyl-tRNA synthetase
VRPLVELLLALRAQARADKRWADSDTIRDGLAAAGVEVRDTPDGVRWEVRR